EYWTSINSNTVDPTTITFTGYYDGWGEHSGMIFPQTYKLDTGLPGYNTPGGGGTARSAYVLDGLSDAFVNYVWRASGSLTQSLTVNSSGTTTFAGAIGNTNPLSNLSVTTTDVTAVAIATTTGVMINNTGTASISGAISGAGATLTKSGAGSLALSGSN